MKEIPCFQLMPRATRFFSLDSKLPLKPSMKAFCMGLPGAMECHSMRARRQHRRTATDVGSVPLSKTIMSGLPRQAMATSSSRTVRARESDRAGADHHAGR
jgi:hypothetical protein